MANNKRIIKTPPDYFRREESAVRLDIGPYIGKVKNNLDPTRSGRLQVYIPDISSGDENNPDNWRTVSYASPFMGSTTQPDTNKQNAFKKVKHTYGFWAVPPDIGNLVLCVFVTGDPNRGFWFACVPNQLGHFMLPGIAGSRDVDSSQIDDPIVKSTYKGKPTVVAEFNENDEKLDWSNFTGLKKPIHEEQYRIYLEQGLEEDYVRGIISSTAQRDAPSAVFGISTPGRPIKDPATDPNYQEKLMEGDIRESDYSIAARKGGHSFVMDDGNFQDKDRLIRLRTSGGHQILMNDSEKIMYIGNSNGTVWIELTGPGHLNIFTSSGFNLRAEGDINLHSDKNVNINANQNVKISAKQGIQLQGKTATLNTVDDLTLFGGKTNIGSSGALNINTSGTASIVGGSGVKLSGATISMNDGVGGDVFFERPESLKFNKLSDTGKRDNKWISVPGALSTICGIAPTHEPWELHKNTQLAPIPATTGDQAASPGSVTPPQGGGAGANAANKNYGGGNGVTSGEAPAKNLPIVECAGTGTPTDTGPKSAQGQGVTRPVSKTYMDRKDNPDLTEGVGPLTPLQTKALMTQLGYSESAFNYGATNQYNYLGKYQMGAPALADLGYIKRDAYTLYGGNKALNYPSSWTGKDGVNSKEDFLNNSAAQEKAMLSLMKQNYNTLLNIGALKSGDDQCTVAGMLAASHLLGAGGARNWRNTGGGSDANGTTGTTYFNRGRYAVDVLAANR